MTALRSAGRVEPGDGGVEEFDGRQLTRRDELRLAERVDRCQLASLLRVHWLGS